MAKTLNVGIIGYGFMGRTHSNAYRKVANFFDVPYKPVLKTICGLEEKEAKAFADRWGFETYATDWHEVIDDKSIDVVRCAGYWLKDAPKRGIEHICWDGCMFPNA
ncbi:MAG: Gfo/Idh/MocA family oxidoreductase, partial [Phycisphaerae bacterium]|nr:Gfo/Idh/MocA family oxidoreductase [Phycisphaerae bacterium]